ncbi:YlzJ-like family protein [Bacillus alkalicellulosilyticus]|uniref:YlzJ-like family protein n=1 Tax=Alkalihalobacterium alkalicellulosilyticum TaxID=1912214 RepID=UPI00099774D3|nr:YlzJ-like family protein [Bacillus alkalicellulosilyticus]
MILYTMLPEEMIFPQEDSFANQKYVQFEGGSLLVEQVNELEFKVVRLISSDPAHYLDNKYAPGSVIQLKPDF